MAVKKRKKVAKKKTLKRKPTVAKRKPAKKRIAKKITKKQPRVVKKNIIGVVTHYFPKVRAAVVKLKVPLSIGDAIKIKGHTTAFTQTVTSMQINHVPITSAKKGDEIGLLVDSRARGNDIVYKP